MQGIRFGRLGEAKAAPMRFKVPGQKMRSMLFCKELRKFAAGLVLLRSVPCGGAADRAGRMPRTGTCPVAARRKQIDVLGDLEEMLDFTMLHRSRMIGLVARRGSEMVRHCCRCLCLRLCLSGPGLTRQRHPTRLFHAVSG